MPPRAFRLEAKSEVIGLRLRHATAPAMPAGRQFKVLLSSRAPAQLSLALRLPARATKGSRTS
jgi:hypothetical protein